MWDVKKSYIKSRLIIGSFRAFFIVFSSKQIYRQNINKERESRFFTVEVDAGFSALPADAADAAAADAADAADVDSFHLNIFSCQRLTGGEKFRKKIRVPGKARLRMEKNAFSIHVEKNEDIQGTML